MQLYYDIKIYIVKILRYKANIMYKRTNIPVGIPYGHAMVTRRSSSPFTFFTAHPTSVGETWLQHAHFALSVAGTLVMAGVAAAVHAVFPALCQTTASRAIDRLHARIHGHRGVEAAETLTQDSLVA